MELSEKNVIIKTELLCKSFITDGELTHIIKNIDLEIYEGDFTVIMGSSGSGKSTLLYMLSGMDEHTSGKVWLQNEALLQGKERQMTQLRREKIGFVFQGMHLIPDLTVYENIVSPTYKTGQTKKAIENKVEQLLSQMEIQGHEHKYPHQLSGGQKQRVAICRALINNPKILFADEPTGALNSAQGEKVLDLFTQIAEEGQSMVMVTHDLKAAARGNRIIFLRDGRIDGILELGKFQREARKERENILYRFLQERGW
ncbi:MAG: ABC transporter ATP-binding protein [Cellulosilyticaceae bacterium]